MKHILSAFISFMGLTFSASAQYDKCASSASLISVYYTAEAHTSYGFGFEAGMQGVDTRLGGFAGIQIQKMSDVFFNKDTAGFRLRASFYFKASYRINEDVSGKGSIFLVAYPALSVQTGFDLKAAVRGVLPLSESKALGVEPFYSVRHKTAGINFLVVF